MPDDDTIPFRPKGKPEQLTLEQVRKMKPEDIEEARQKGHLEELLKHGGKPPKEQP